MTQHEEQAHFSSWSLSARAVNKQTSSRGSTVKHAMTLSNLNKKNKTGQTTHTYLLLTHAGAQSVKARTAFTQTYTDTNLQTEITTDLPIIHPSLYFAQTVDCQMPNYDSQKSEHTLRPLHSAKEDMI